MNCIWLTTTNLAQYLQKKKKRERPVHQMVILFEIAEKYQYLFLKYLQNIT